MALVGRYNSLQVVKHTNFGLYLDGAQDGEILLPNRYIPKDIPSEDEDWLNVFIYLDSDDKLIATTEKPKVQVGEFASLKVVEVNSIGIFLDWGLPKDLLVAEETAMGFKAIINNKHWGLIHKNEVFKFLRSGKQEKGFIKEVRSDGNISLSLQPVGEQLASSLNAQILGKLRDNNGVLPVSDKSDPQVISNLFGVSKGNFKKAIGALYKQGQIVIHADRIELV
jgi:predicted RNA-binding protein (virulence factor B family)